MKGLLRMKVLKIALFVLVSVGPIACGDDPSVLTAKENTSALCSDNKDNDNDGLTDCDDDDCAGFDECESETDSNDIPEDTDTEPGSLVSGLEISAINFYQSVEIPVMEDFKSISSDIPLILEKDAVMRVFLERQHDWDNRYIWVRVEFEQQSGEVETVEESFFVSGDSKQKMYSSTVNFRIPALLVANNTSFSVTLLEAGGYLSDVGDEAKARWPVEGYVALDVIDTVAPFKLVIVPIRYHADDSGREPELNEEQLQWYMDEFYKYYPITGVDITIAPTLDWHQEVLAFGDGWGELLSAIAELRSDGNAAYNEYYYGLFIPDDALDVFCVRGCMLGLSYLALSADDSWARSSIGLGFPGMTSAETMIHEIGHAAGRLHAPCGTVDAIDPYFPYSDGSIGVMGYDLLNESTITPVLHKDFMSYCDPIGISDYTYEALLKRHMDLNSISKARGTATLWATIMLSSDDSSAKMGPILNIDTPPEGPKINLQLLDANGQEQSVVSAVYREYSENLGGIAMFPVPENRPVKIRLEGYPAVDYRD